MNLSGSIQPRGGMQFRAGMRLRRGERGIAILTAIWMTIIGVMLVTTISSIIAGNISLSANIAFDTKARVTAMSGIMRAIGLLIADRPSVQTGTPGIVISEIRHRKVAERTVRINGFLQDLYGTTDDSVALFNYGSDTVDISGWWLDDDGTVNDAQVPSNTQIGPLKGIWVTGAFPTTAQTLTLYTGWENDTGVVDTWNKPALAADSMVFCLPDGANGDTTKTSYWIQIKVGGTPFQHIPASIPPRTRMNGRGVWLDDHRLEKHVGNSVDSTLTFAPGSTFVCYDSTLVVRSNLPGWTLPLAATAIISGGDSIPRLNANVVPGSDSIAFVLRRVSNSGIVSHTGLLNNTNAVRYTRATDSPLIAMTAAGAGGVSAGTPDATYSSAGQFYISEVYDSADSASVTALISKILVGISASAQQEAVEIYNPGATAINLAVTPLRIWTGSGSVTSGVYLNAGTIPAFGFYLWSDIAGCTGLLGVSPDTTNSGPGQVNISNSQAVGLYSDAACLDTGYAPGASDNTTERKAVTGSTAATMALGGSHVDSGNAWDNAGSSADFITHTAQWDSRYIQWKNRSSAIEASAAAPVSGDNPNEFVEISLGPDPDRPTGGAADRRHEFVEIQNNDTQARNLVTAQWWISAGLATPNATSKRYIYPLFGGSASLTAGAVGVIVATDADTPAIAALNGKTTGNIQWFGLGAEGAGAAADTQIGGSGLTGLGDIIDTIVVGYGASGGGVPGSPTYWFGVSYNDTTSNAVEKSWTKLYLSQLEDTTAPFTGTPWNYYELVSPTPGDGLSAAGRAGYDGAGDSWYSMSYDSFVLLSTDDAGNKLYYRVRIFDEGAKVNLNNISMKTAASWETGMLYHMLNQNPNPPFASEQAYNLSPGGLGDSNSMQFARELISMWKATPSSAKLLTPGSVYMLRCTQGYTGSSARNTRFDSVYMPFTTVYGYNEPNVLPINLNMAETPVLRAAFIQALARNPSDSHYPAAANLSVAQGRAIAAADSLYRFLTKNDAVASNDTGVYDLAHLHALFSNTDSTRAAVIAAYSSGRLAEALATNSTNYFMIYATGFAFRPGANPASDTPLATSRIIAVVRRLTTADKAEIVYWRENFEFASAEKRTMIFPISSRARRYPKYAWDPEQ